MPFYPRKKKTFRKKTYTPKKKTVRAKNRNTRWLTAIPDHQNWKHNFTDTRVVNNAVGSVGYVIFVPNSVVDCISTIGSNQQAYLRDQLFGMYENARVLKWRIIITVQGLHQNSPSECALGLARAGTPDTDVNLLRERKYSKYAVLTEGRKTLSMTFDSAKYRGLKRGAVMKNDEYLQSDAIDLATDQKDYVQFVIRDLTSSMGANPICYISTKITQWVRWERPLDLPSS